MLFPQTQSSIWATGPSRESELKIVRSSSFAKKNNEEVSDWYHASKHWLFTTFASLFSSLRASSRCLPSFASRRRLDCSASADDRSGPRVADPASISTILKPRENYEEMLAKKGRLGTDEDALVLRLNVQANFPERRRAQAGPLSGHIAMRRLPDGSISGCLRKRATANPFTRASCSS